MLAKAIEAVSEGSRPAGIGCEVEVRTEPYCPPLSRHLKRFTAQSVGNTTCNYLQRVCQNRECIEWKRTLTTREFSPSGHRTPSEDVPIEGQTNEANAIRSENNILQWAEYLPEDCIQKMIEMGWDVTT